MASPDPTRRYQGGGIMPAWDRGELSAPPVMDARSWLLLLGPGVIMAGNAVGTGEWLVGPAATAQYGATMLWLAMISIAAQVVFNIEVVRYALYCGEPVHLGFMRTKPGPRFWFPFYLILDFYAIWPMNAGAAAIPIAAALLGHLPTGDQPVIVAGLTTTEDGLVRILSIVVFLVAFLPLIFGGAIYRMLEYMMAIKLVLLLLFLTIVSVSMVSPRFWIESVRGLVGVGMIPLQPETLVAGRHFLATQPAGDTTYRIRGSLQDGQPVIVGFSVLVRGRIQQEYKPLEKVSNPEHRAARDALAQEVAAKADPHGFFVRTVSSGSEVITMTGRISADGCWEMVRGEVAAADGEHSYETVSAMPDPLRQRCQNILDHRGNEDVHFVTDYYQHRRIPPLDWAILAAFASFAGTGGSANTLFSNFSRDKGWGMGSRVGAIASAVGGTTISLSHVGMNFEPTESALQRWRGWIRWILRDQICIWMTCAILGMVLPCMLSLEFLRNAPISGNRVSAMLAEGLSNRYPAFGQGWWYLTLLIGFLIIFPGQVVSGDSIARRWTDVSWTVSPWLKKLPECYVKYVYYSILAAYAFWGIFVLLMIPTFTIIKIVGVLANVALGFCMFHTIYVNRTLLPPQVRPHWLVDAAMVCGGLFFFAVSGMVAYVNFA